MKLTQPVFSPMFVELSPLTTGGTDKAELHLTGSQGSPGAIFVWSIIIKKCLYRECKYNDLSVL